MTMTRMTGPLLCISAFLVILPAVCAGQQPGTPLPFAEHKFLERKVQISIHQKSLAELLDNLNSAANVNVLADGLPDKASTDLDVQGTVRDVLNQIGASFDCSWSVSKSGIVILSRRFTDPAEHPQIHLKEMQQMVRDIHSAFRIVPKETLTSDFRVLLNELAHSFSPEQAAAYRDGRLTGADLNPPQFTCLTTAIENYTFATAISRCDEMLPLMDGMPKSFLQLKPLARPDKYLDPTDPFSNAARFPSFDYLYITRDRNDKLTTYYFGKWSVN